MRQFSGNFINNVNKFITLIFTTLFVVNFFIIENITYTSVLICIILLGLNALNIITKKGVSKFCEALVYECIALLGIYYIHWIYVLVFVLVAEVVHFFRIKPILIITMIINSILFLLSYSILAKIDINRGYYLWQIIDLLIVTIALSIYFINDAGDTHNEIVYESINDNVYNLDQHDTLEQKYNELLKEHKDIVLLKDIMDVSNQNADINEILMKINDLLYNNFENIQYCTVFLYDRERNTYRIATSNVPSQYLKTLSSIDDFGYFDDVIKYTHSKVLSSQFELPYPTANERRIVSAFCMPLQTRKDLIGLVLLESQETYAFKNIDVNKFNLVRYYISLVTENKLWLDRIQKMALIDGLTGVYNRNYLFDFLENQVKWHKEHNKVMCLSLFDIDFFKKFNDTYGHLFGDLVLKTISNLVKESIRDIDIVARYGGEEFIIVMIDTDIETARIRIEEIRQKIQDNVVTNEEGVSANVTASFGIAEFADFSYNIKVKDLIERADKALYDSKHDGRNRVTVYKPSN